MNETQTKTIIGDDSLTWQVYTIESSCAEKLHALIVRPDNSRSKDVFDLYYFLPKCRKDYLKEAIKETFKARKDTLPDSIKQHIRSTDYKLLQQGWKSVIAGSRETLEFDTAFYFIVDYFTNIL